MPRPGPRPYECVRRAWHSDRHQPIRGSLIQEIFRIANEIHSPATKKNKEWQEKLPVVVLKAEEIMYSKANSEAEYMDLKTLLDRVNDAVNTIIRPTESTESGEFLQPCIEAALNLGCVPRRASRSQRNSSSRCYLSATTPDSTHVLPTDSTNAREGNHKMNPLLMSSRPTVLRPVAMNSKCLENELSCITTELSFMSNKLHSIDACCPTLEASLPSSSHSVYPLYYGTYPQIPETSLATECDLSLRLGPLSVPCKSFESKSSLETEDIGSNKPQAQTKFNVAKKGLSFYCRDNAAVPLELYSGVSAAGDEALTEASMIRKRKVVEDLDDRQFCQQPRLLPSHYASGARIAGL
ncbi:hypothetical protein Ancab_023159 [Ancistrocladus abbreviatus]